MPRDPFTLSYMARSQPLLHSSQAGGGRRSTNYNAVLNKDSVFMKLLELLTLISHLEHAATPTDDLDIKKLNKVDCKCFGN